MMKRYKYSSVQDPKNEPIGIIAAHNHENAIQLAAERKRLDTETFLTLFNIQEIKKNEKSTRYNSD